MSPFLTENSIKIKSHTGEGADRYKPCAKVFSCQKNLKVHLVTIWKWKVKVCLQGICRMVNLDFFLFPDIFSTALWRKPHWKWEIKEFAKMTTSPPIFGRYELFQIEYLDTTFGQFHFLAYIWSELIIQRRQTFLIALFSWSSSRLAEGCEKSEGTSWTDS